MTTPKQSTQPSAPAPVTTTTEMVWRGERVFDAGPAGRTHRIDANAKEAPGPVEALLNAVVTCSSVDIIEIIAKRKTPVERLTAQVSAERRAEFPRRVQRIEIEYVVEGAAIEREAAERAVQLSFERYCSVAASLAPDIVVITRLTLNGERLPPVHQRVWTPTV